MDILDVAEAIGSIVERVKTPTIDWKQRALEAEESEAESNELLEAATHEVGMAKSKLTQIGDLLVECGAPPRHTQSPYAVPHPTTALERAEWLKSKIVEIGGLGGKPRSHKPIPEILKAYDDALEKADKNVPLVGWVNRHREVTQQAILAVVELVRKEPAQDPVTKSVETGGSAYPIRNFNSLVAEAITLAGGKPGTIHLFDAISNLSLERDRLRDELDAARKRIAQAEANAVALATELRAEKRRAERLTARVREIADDVLALQPADADPMALCLDIAAAYHKTREKPVDAPEGLVNAKTQISVEKAILDELLPTFQSRMPVSTEGSEGR